jgi:hypothetical protein
VDGRLTSIDALDWAGARMREKLEAMEETRRLAVAEQARLAEKIEALAIRTAAALAPFERDHALLENACKVYAEIHRAELLKGLRPDAKTRKLPNITVAWKSTDAHYRYRLDMAEADRKKALLEWAIPRTGPQTPLTKPAEGRVLVLEEVKRYAEWMRSEAKNAGETPTTPPGLEYVPESETLTITTGGKKP